MVLYAGNGMGVVLGASVVPKLMTSARVVVVAPPVAVVVAIVPSEGAEAAVVPADVAAEAVAVDVSVPATDEEADAMVVVVVPH